LRKKDLSCFPRQLKLFLGDMIISPGKKGLSCSPRQLKFLPGDNDYSLGKKRV